MLSGTQIDPHKKVIYAQDLFRFSVHLYLPPGIVHLVKKEQSRFGGPYAESKGGTGDGVEGRIRRDRVACMIQESEERQALHPGQ